MPHRQRLLHLRSTQINEPVAHPNIFGDINIVFNRERRRFSGIQNVQRIYSNLNLACIKFGVDSALIDDKTDFLVLNMICPIVFDIGDQPPLTFDSGCYLNCFGERVFGICI